MSGKTRKGSKTKTTNTRKRKTAAATAVQRAEESDQLLLEEEPELLHLFPPKMDVGLTGKTTKVDLNIYM